MRFLMNGLLLGLLALPAHAQSPSPAAPVQPQRPPAAPPGAGSSASPGAAAPPNAQASAGASLDLNFATTEELQALPGIGPARAAAIVSHRPYRSPDEIVAKASVPQSVVAGGRGRLTATQMNVNAATKREMIDTLPGIGEARADAIIRGRPYTRPEELVTKAGVPQAAFDRIRHAVILR